MKILIRILLLLASVIAIILIVAIFTKKDYSLQREIVINKPSQQVYDYLKISRNQEFYNKWWMTDPNSKKDFVGTDGTVGFISKWDSENKNVGKGEQETVAMKEGERIEYKLRFIKPMEGNADTYYALESVNENQTKVTWGFSSSMPYPLNAMLIFMSMDNMLGKDLQESLNNMKMVVEKS